MSTSSNKIPRIELTRERSSTLESIQSLTRAIRESLRLHSVRRAKKRRQKKAAKGDGAFLDVKDSRRLRSKSMDEGGNVDETLDNYNEISEVGISGVIVSDIGPTTECAQALIARNAAQKGGEPERAKTNSDEVFEDAKVSADIAEEEEQKHIEAEGNQHRRHSKSVDEYELAHLRKKKQQKQADDAAEARRAANSGSSKQQQQMSLDIVDHEMMNKPGRQLSMPNAGCSIRRGSKDDAEVNTAKVDASVLRKRFARLLDTLRSHKFSISSLEEGGSSGGSSTLKQPDSQH